MPAKGGGKVSMLRSKRVRPVPNLWQGETRLGRPNPLSGDGNSLRTRVYRGITYSHKKGRRNFEGDAKLASAGPKR